MPCLNTIQCFFSTPSKATIPLFFCIINSKNRSNRLRENRNRAEKRPATLDLHEGFKAK